MTVCVFELFVILIEMCAWHNGTIYLCSSYVTFPTSIVRLFDPFVSKEKNKRTTSRLTSAVPMSMTRAYQQWFRFLLTYHNSFMYIHICMHKYVYMYICISEFIQRKISSKWVRFAEVVYPDVILRITFVDLRDNYYIGKNSIWVMKILKLKPDVYTMHFSFERN